MRKNITTLDIESSSYFGYPIQIGFIDEESNKYSAYIRPTDKWIKELKWDSKSESVHKIKLEYLLEKGEDPISVALELNKRLSEKDVLVGSSFDVRWLTTLYDHSQIKREFNLFVLTEILPIEVLSQWNSVFSVVYKEQQLELHDALSDAVLMQETFKRITELY